MQGTPDLSEFGDFPEVYDIAFGLGQDQPPTSVVIKKQFLRKINYQLSPKEVIQQILNSISISSRGVNEFDTFCF